MCHLSDVHLGYRRFNRLTKQGFNQREADVSQVFREAIERIIAIRPHITLIAGDLFHAVRPSNAVLLFCFRQLKRLVAQTNAPCVVLAGNHEVPKRSDSGSPLRLLSEIDGLFVADAAFETLRFPDLSLSVSCLPHSALKDLGSLELHPDPRFAYNILLSHLQLEQGWQSDFGGVTLKLKDLNVHEWDYVALGHIHVFSEFGLNTAYSGSLEHTSHNFWSEASHNKGFVELLLPQGKRLFHALTAPRQVRVLEPLSCGGRSAAEIDALLSQRVDGVAGGIAGKLLRIELVDIPREVQRQLDFKQIRRWKAEALHFGIEFRSAEQLQAGMRFRAGSGAQLGEELERFAKQWQFNTASSETVSELLKNYLLKLEQQDEAA